MYEQHRQQLIKAAYGITIGMVLASLTAYQCHETWIPGEGSKWGLLILLAAPIIAWGCSHLAQERGYPTSVAYCLFIVSFFAATLIGFNEQPKAIGFAFLFVGLMPPVILLSLPVRFAAMRQSYTRAKT
jgi:hypothetical protein